MGIYRQGNIFWVSKCINGIQYRKSAETSSKMEAKAFFESWISELKDQVKNGKPIIKQEPKKEITFSELSVKYLEFANGRLKSYDRLRSFINTLNKYFSKKRLTDFTVLDIENMQSDIIKQVLSVAYANRLTAVLKRMFTKALEWELVNDDIIRTVKKVKLLKGEIKRLRYLSDDESERLISNCNNDIKPIVITALNTGMRKSEILHLTWDRIDLKNRVILLDITKNGERREIPINDTLFDTLSGIVRNLKIDYVFYNPDTLKPYYDIKKSFARALNKSHIIDFRFHDLRHTFASSLVMNGIDLATIQKLLGHKTINMTLRYAHLSNVHLKDAVNTLNKKNYHNFIIVDENDKTLKPANS
ncbi:MAG: tyrosine-type recombinase/integrase [Candidatus Acidulodesulfobacterium sp.]